MINAPGYSLPDQWQVQVQAQIQVKARCPREDHRPRPGRRVRAAHFTPIDDVAAAVATALARAGAASTLCVLPQGPQTIPYLARHLDERPTRPCCSPRWC